MANFNLESRNINVDFTNKEYFTIDNKKYDDFSFQATQGINAFSLTFSFTNDGQAISNIKNLKVYLVTSDLLDYKSKSELILSEDRVDVEVGLNAITISSNSNYDAFKKMFTSFGKNQIVFEIDGMLSLPFTYTVVRNPISKLTSSYPLSISVPEGISYEIRRTRYSNKTGFWYPYKELTPSVNGSLNESASLVTDGDELQIHLTSTTDAIINSITVGNQVIEVETKEIRLKRVPIIGSGSITVTTK